LANWYLSKLNETTVNKSHDDILIEYLKNISTETISSPGRIPQTTKLSIHNLPFFFSLRKSIPTKIIESIVIGFTIINDALLRTLYAHIKYKYSHYQMHIFVWHTTDLDVFISVWKQIYYSCTFQYVHINLYLICAYRVRNNASFIIVNPITMDSILDQLCVRRIYASDNANRKRF
jgi:hypothetical protein